MIPDEIATRLRCPDCGAQLAVDETRASCASGHGFPMTRGVLDCAPADVEDAVADTAASFGYEWTTFDEVQPGDERDWELYFADVPREELRAAVAVDVGCGMARYSRVTAKHVRALVALDLSDAVFAAAKTLESSPNAIVVRADLRHPPLERGGFDFVSSLGVLHHLPDPEAGFRSVVDLLRPGGSVLLYLYSRESGRSLRGVMIGAATALRRITVRMPHRALRAASVPIAAVLRIAFVVPGRMGDRRGWRALSRLPMRYYRDRPWRDLWLDTFDRLSAPIEFRYTWPDIEPWFDRARLEVRAVREDTGLFVLARRPAQ